MATTKLYLDLRGKAKDGRGNVIITLSHNRTTTSIATGIRLSKNEWDGKRVIGRTDADILNASLADKKIQIDKRIAVLMLDDSFATMSAPEIKKQIEQKKTKQHKDSHGIEMVFEDYLRKPLRENTKDIYRLTLKKVLDFGKSGLTIEDINYKWIVGFESYLAETQSVNGRAIYLRSLRAVCNHAVKTRLVSDYAFSGYSVKQEETRKRNISMHQLRELYYFKCKPYQQRYKDYFFLMLFLIGINSIDLFLARPDAVQNGRLEYIRHKTGKHYSIKIEPEAQELLDKYKGKNFLVEVMDRCKDYVNFVHEMNDALKLIGPEVEEEYQPDLFSKPVKKKSVIPIIPNLSTYYSRHTWATLAYEIGIPVDIISQAHGHAMGNKTTLIYIKPDQSKVDDANRKFIDALFENN